MPPSRRSSSALRLSGLKAWDATERDLPASFTVLAGIVRIVVDDRDAVYPVTVDPLLGSPTWSVTGAGGLGLSAATAGDVNGDGFSDVIVGAPGHDGGQTDEGRVLVYFGSASGLATTPAWTRESNQASASYGDSVATAGDVNGDGFSDVIVGAPGFDAGQADEGRAFVHLGSATGLSTTVAWSTEGNQAGAALGTSVATAGDVNGDGLGDVLVGAPGLDDGQTDEGRAFTYLGSSSGLVTPATWTAEGELASAAFGSSVGAAATSIATATATSSSAERAWRRPTTAGPPISRTPRRGRRAAPRQARSSAAPSRPRAT